MSSPMSIRIPGPLRARLTRAAAAEYRSLSNLVVVLVEQALAQRDGDPEGVLPGPGDREVAADAEAFGA